MPQEFSPDYLAYLNALSINSRKKYAGLKQGSHYSLKRGHGIEFADYRKYEPGDDPRRIDHRLLARSDRIYIKQFSEEQDIDVHLMVDTSASVQEFTEKNHFINLLVLSLASLTVQKQDRLQLSMPGRFTAKKYFGKGGIYNLSEDLFPTTPYSSQNYAEDLQLAVAACKFPGVCYYFSDFMQEPAEVKQQIDYFLARNIDLRLVQVLLPEEVSPDYRDALVTDSETKADLSLNFTQQSSKEYQNLLAEHQAALREIARKTNCLWYPLVADEDLKSAITKLV